MKKLRMDFEWNLKFRVSHMDLPCQNFFHKLHKEIQWDAKKKSSANVCLECKIYQRLSEFPKVCQASFKILFKLLFKFIHAISKKMFLVKMCTQKGSSVWTLRFQIASQYIQLINLNKHDNFFCNFCYFLCI